jgi:hypothetical protein
MEGTWNEGKPSQNLNSSVFTNNSGVMLVGILELINFIVGSISPFLCHAVESPVAA